VGTKHVIIKTKSGRVYEYDYPTSGKRDRKKTEHHADFRPKPKPLTTLKPTKGRSLRVRRKKVLLRDNRTCQMCGEGNRHMHVHHKDLLGPHLVGKAANNEMTNLVTLCPACHIGLHYKTSVRNTMIRQLYAGGHLTYDEIGRRFGVSRQRIAQIVRGRKYYGPRRVLDTYGLSII
jgi:5-methylcytosine-specific restriction endonuclease McrA